MYKQMMDYSDTFLSFTRPRKLSRLESIILNYSLLHKLAEEGFSKNYEKKLLQDYYCEDKLLSWLDMISQTPGYKLFRQYYRPELHNIDNIPSTGGALLVSNHSSIFFGDVAPIYIGVYEKRRRLVYGLGHKLLKDSDFLKSIGGIYANRDLAIRLLTDDKLTLVCPEGIEGACRSKLHAYHVREVQGFSRNAMGYLKVAYKADKPIIPIATIGGEESCLILGNIKPQVSFMFNLLDRTLHISRYNLGKKSLEWIEGSKIIPLLLAPPLPLKVHGYVGKPINVRDYVDKNERLEDYIKANNVVMSSLQELIDKGLGRRLRFYRFLRRFSEHRAST